MGNRFPIGYKVKQARMEKGLTQCELGKLYGCSSQYIGLLELGYRSVGLKSMKKLAAVLDKPLSYFMNEESPPEKILIPDQLTIIERKLNEITGRYEAIAKTSEIWRVKVIKLGTKPADFKVKEGDGYISIPREELKTLPDEAYNNICAIHITSDMGEEWRIHKGEYVVLDYLTLHTDGFHLMTYQNQMMFRKLIFSKGKITMIDPKGIKIEAKEKDVVVSGIIHLIWSSKQPPQL